MLASMASARTSLSPREQSRPDLQHITADLPPSLNIEDRLCPGCKKSAMSEQGGLVVAFGQSFFHVACFKCAKCGNQVTADTNLLLLSDGSPICADCSYNCNICHLPILDEAIMTGDDSYHAHCFKCKVCKSRIDELIFAKTSQGIYCMKCHNARMIKIRKYTQKKAERERNGGSGSSRTRDVDAGNYYQDSRARDSFSRPSSGSNGKFSTQQDTSRPSTARSTEGPVYTRPSVKPKGPPQTHNGRVPQYSVSSYLHDTSTATQLRSPPSPPSPSLSPAVTVAPPPESERSYPVKSSTLPVPALGPDADPDGRPRSYDDGVRPLQILFGQNTASDSDTLQHDAVASAFPEGLTVTSRQEKRRSINPGLKLPNFSAALPSRTINATLSPASAAFSDFRPPRSPTSPGGQESPHGQGQNSRPTSQASQGSSVRSYHSFMTPTDRDLTGSRSPSMTTLDYEDHTVILKPSQSQSRGTSRSPSPAPIRAADNQLHSKINGNRLSSMSNLSVEDRASTISSRSNSPYHLVDVPRGIEDGSDSDGGGEAASPHQSQRYSSPPELPPKSDEECLDVQSPSTTEDADASGLSQYDVFDDMSESSPVERTSHTTFIAPALPPIRISLDSTGFSKLLDSVQGPSALKSLDQIATLLRADDVYGSPVKSTSEVTLTAAGPSSTTTDVQQPQKSQKASRVSLPEEHETKPLEIKKMSQDNKPLPIPSLSPVAPERKLPNSDLSSSNNVTRITTTDLGPGEVKQRDITPDAIITRLRGILKDSQDHGIKHIQLDVELLEAAVVTLDSKKVAFDELKEKFDGMKRTSKNFIDGVLVAQAEYDREQKARRDAEAEVTRLRVLLSGQAAKLTAMSSEDRRYEVRQQISKELNDSLSGLEHDLSRLKLERDITLAEVEELSSTKVLAAPEKPALNLGRSLTKRLDTLKKQYQRDLIPLTEQRETLSREIAELRAIRDMFLEETTALNARNEELAQLSHIYTRRLESIPEAPLKHGQIPGVPIPRSSFEKLKNLNHAPTQSVPALAPSLSASTSGSSNSTIHDERHIRPLRQDTDMHTPRKLKWMVSNKTKSAASPAQEPNNGKGHMDHNFQQLSVLRFTRCDQCGDKLWGSQLRCTICSASIHIRCAGAVQLPCAQHSREDSLLVPSMFGRDLIEQVQNDSKGDDRQVPIIVEKCIQAVEATALEYEGIYRKTGGSSQSKMITQLFERGDYTSFDLLDTDKFNDICSVTSVLKNYFRSLPNPLLTFQLYEQFVQGISIKDVALKNKTLSDLVKQLPSEHYYTLRVLMIHLGRIHERKEKNLMNARNLGVVFGPTLIRSPDPSAEFDDMAQRALFVEWLVENAPKLFNGEA